jgi:hypothetical protein
MSQLLMVFACVFAFIAALFIDKLARPPFNLHFGWLAVAFWLLSLVLGGFGLR